MLAQARAQNAAKKSFWAGFWNYLGRRPVAAVSVPLNAQYVPSDLRLALENIAERYDARPGAPGFELGTLTFRSGTGGQQLDIAFVVAQWIEDAVVTQPQADLLAIVRRGHLQVRQRIFGAAPCHV